MKNNDLKIKEAEDYLELAKVYHDIANCRTGGKGHWRGEVDANYNSAELCIKGLLVLQMLDIPSTHGGVAQKFGQIYINTGVIDKKFGRILNKALRLRNLARYDCSANTTKSEIKEVNDLVKAVIEILEGEIKKLTHKD